ncbi:hypothetical protein NQ315_014092 [Exocentrus adspersus]|uniref:Uncharacterized protein n=1 Tax=Exocentrus adspersus TaxID=1586481 RepID=A0AAV8VVY9_9CUCU|nr:hypothetical protein NQ315_014092 [Exocentrus adspersus]
MHWDQATIIAKEQGWKKRKLKEAVFMAITPNCISTPSLQIKDLWMLIIREDLKRSAGSTPDRIRAADDNCACACSVYKSITPATAISASQRVVGDGL